jgi:hypothetical protein
MKQKIIYLSIIAMFFITCSKQQEIDLGPKLESIDKNSNKKSAHIFELIVTYLDNAGNYHPGTFCMYEVATQALWQCQSQTVNGLDFLAARWDTEVPTFKAGVDYYVFPPGNYPKDILKIKYAYIYCSPSPDSYFTYNKDTKKFTVVSTGCGVTYTIQRYNNSPFFYDYD